jgi:acetylornithine deacetylase/succinyl-diaminopimelate desuccinylase family protein
VQPLAEAVAERRDGLHGLLRDLIAFRTESQAKEATHFPEEIRRCMAYVTAFLEDLGFSIETWDVGPSATFEAHPAIVARLAGEGGGRSLAFNGHLDVVPVGDPAGWTHDPFGGAVDDGRLYGRGAADMKGGVSAALWATKVALESGFRPRGDLYFHVVSDEEVVGNGTREVVARAPRPDAVVSLEPSYLALSMTEGGLVHFRIEVEGVEAHAASRYLSVHAGGNRGGGVNAIEKMVKILVGLQELEREWANAKSHPVLPRGYNTILPGIIVGGPGGGKDGRLNLFSNAGTTPNYCSLEYGIWFYPSETLDDVRAEVEEHVAAVCRTDPWLRDHPPRFTWGINHIYFPPAEVAVDHPVVTTMAEALAAVGLDTTPRGFGAATDLAWYAEQGIPGLIFGAGTFEQCHVADEFVDIEALLTASQTYALFLERWSG